MDAACATVFGIKEEPNIMLCWARPKQLDLINNTELTIAMTL